MRKSKPGLETPAGPARHAIMDQLLAVEPVFFAAA